MTMLCNTMKIPLNVACLILFMKLYSPSSLWCTYHGIVTTSCHDALYTSMRLVSSRRLPHSGLFTIETLFCFFLYYGNYGDY